MRPVIWITCLAFMLGACDQTKPTGQTEIGRYRYIAPTGSYPAMVLDSATGCVEQLDMMGDVGAAIKKSQIEFVGGSDRACTASGITAIREGVSK